MIRFPATKGRRNAPSGDLQKEPRDVPKGPPQHLHNDTVGKVYARPSGTSKTNLLRRCQAHLPGTSEKKVACRSVPLVPVGRQNGVGGTFLSDVLLSRPMQLLWSSSLHVLFARPVKVVRTCDLRAIYACR